ncbi:hypothetical protein G3I67_13070 [Orrella sp. NBD-18]|uniref:Transposase n=1 Tax=Sheuella amnicola TaxID=2707330 RepID=A0A6B2R076_9BURK|nr:hypothetical protein [Sheuella amnicola]NDY84160.1 hypothetical protein [Sheuella amnicola]
MQINHSSRLTDSLERELLANALDEQFRPHPIRTVKKLVRGLVSFRNRARSKVSIDQMI